MSVMDESNNAELRLTAGESIYAAILVVQGCRPDGPAW